MWKKTLSEEGCTSEWLVLKEPLATRRYAPKDADHDCDVACSVENYKRQENVIK